MQEPFNLLEHLEESPQSILLPSKRGTLSFVAWVTATAILCIASFSLVNLLP